MIWVLVLLFYGGPSGGPVAVEQYASSKECAEAINSIVSPASLYTPMCIGVNKAK